MVLGRQSLNEKNNFGSSDVTRQWLLREREKSEISPLIKLTIPAKAIMIIQCLNFYEENYHEFQVFK